MRIACVLKTGGVYRPEHVYALRDMCQQWLPEHDFVCLTDLPELDCNTKPLMQNLAGWWSKLELFDAFTSGETLFLDLDTVVRGPCVDLLHQLGSKNFIILRDFGRGQLNPKSMSMGSGLMFWRDDYRWIFEMFMIDRPEKSLRGDQDFIEHAFKRSGKPVEYWQDFTDNVCSFKIHIRDKSPASSAEVVCFHGSPRPWAQSLIPYPPQTGKHPSLTMRKGWMVPTHDDHVLEASLRELGGLHRMMKYCSKRRTAIQAGGNIGIWASAVADNFTHCITTEPEPDNFSALEINTKKIRNITRHKIALGKENGTTNIFIQKGNAGACYCTPGKDVTVSTIDSLSLFDVDFIQLDIEGFEHDAILGAQETIKANRPVIVVELNGLGQRYGHSNQSTINLLQSLGYQTVEHILRDVVFIHNSQLK